MIPSTVFVGCGAGFADERPDAVIPVAETLARRTGPRYVIFETLGERTLALAQIERQADPEAGYTPQLTAFMRPILRLCQDSGIVVVANFGAANPLAAGRRLIALADEVGARGLRVGVVEGDDLRAYVPEPVIRGWPIIEGIPLGDERIIAANVYLGADPIVTALRQQVDIVVTGRGTDSALVLAPLMHEFGWQSDDLDLLAAGTLAGHLLECSAQVSGGYFADPGYKNVPDLARVGLPIGEIDAAGRIVIGKAEATGGIVSTLTVKEQLLYELHDPSAYLVPDVTLDITEVVVDEIAPNRVRVAGARGRPAPKTLKATISVDGGWLAEGEISYAGPNALARARLAAAVLAERVSASGSNAETRIDIIGTSSVFDSRSGDLRRDGAFAPDGDYRVRLAAGCVDRDTADRMANEVIGLYSTGPAGGGGVRKRTVGRVQTRSALIERSLVRTSVHVLEQGRP